jgi:X-Pro dipeptidyl-peptidase
MPRGRLLLLALGALLAATAGCIGTGEDPVEAQNATDPVETPTQDYVPIDEANLSQPTHDVGEKVTDRVTASVDDTDLYVEVWTPEGEEGPFPTVLHSTPYRHLDQATAATGLVTGLEEAANFWVERGYAYVVAHVRGFGDSEGCVEVWGEDEQADQARLVEWITEQGFSDGNVGMIGVSYPGTTPMEAAVQAPEGLEAIVPVAGLTDPYYDWHYGGVPNGESGPAGSPAAYQGIGAVVPLDPTDGRDWAESAADTGCGTAPLVTGAYQTDGVYTDFYEARNLTTDADQVEAAVLYAQGFEDVNVKPSQALNWFNALDTEKKGVFGHWGHTTPERGDWQDLALAWFDEHLKDRDTNVTEGPQVEVHTNVDTWRSDTAFPTERAEDTPLYLDAPDALTWTAPQEGSAELTVDRAEASAQALAPATSPDELVFDAGELEQDVYLSGVVGLPLSVTLEGGENAFLAAELVAVDGNERETVTYGQLNLALDDDVTSYDPVPEGERTDVRLRFQPVEHVLEAGEELELVLRPVDQLESTTPEATLADTLTVHTGGEDASRLSLPLLEDRPDEELPDPVRE